MVCYTQEHCRSAAQQRPATDQGRTIHFPRTGHWESCTRADGSRKQRLGLIGFYRISRASVRPRVRSTSRQFGDPIGRCLGECSDLSPLSEIPPDSIQGLYFNIESDPKDQFEHIGALTGLRFLSFRSVPLSDGQILKLANLTNLEDLTCSVNGFQDKGFGIHDRALRVIAKFKKLKRLDLRSNPITDEGLRLLEGCQSLEILSLDGTQVTGTGFDSLLNLPNLKIISFGSYQNGAPRSTTKA